MYVHAAKSCVSTIALTRVRYSIKPGTSSDDGGCTADSATSFGFFANWMSFKTFGSSWLPWQFGVSSTVRQTSLLKMENPVAMIQYKLNGTSE